MAIQRSMIRNPWREFDALTDRLGLAFDTPFTLSGSLREWQPVVSVEESADELVLVAELPGMTATDIDLEIEDNVLTLRGEKEEVREEGEETRYHIQERRYGRFSRQFTLPRTVSSEGITAEFEDGLLRVRMPKVAEARSRRITIGSTPEIVAGDKEAAADRS